MSTPILDGDTDLEPPAAGSWWSRQTVFARVALVVIPALVLILLAVIAFPRSTPPPAGSSSPATGQTASGCLGGAEDLNAAVTYAQANAPLTGVGAAEFLATLGRWGAQASPADEQALLPKLVTPELLSGWSGPDADDGSTTTDRPKLYQIVEASSTAAKVEILGDKTVTPPGGRPETTESWGTFPLIAVDGVWRLSGPSTAAEYTQLVQSGTAFQGSC